MRADISSAAIHSALCSRPRHFSSFLDKPACRRYNFRIMSDRKIRAVFFDAGNTLLFLDFAQIIEELAESGINADEHGLRDAEIEARRRVDEYMSRDDRDDNMIWEIYFTTMFAGVGIDDRELALEIIKRLRSRDRLHNLWRHAPPQSSETLARLKSDGYILGVISNADGRVARFLEEAGLSQYLDFIIDSKLVGVEKPDPAIFRIALEQAGEPPEACVHVGDIISADVVGARSVGVLPVLLDPADIYSPDCVKIKCISEIVPLVKQWNNESE
jgi:HAD superfamily hydrolase (TIGR01509 family)